jgi:hypothetical protein
VLLFIVWGVSPFPYVFSFRIFGDLENYTLLETLGSSESEKQCLHFFQASYGRHLGFSKWRLFFLKSGYISASKHHRHMILVSKPTLLRSKNLMQYLKMWSNTYKVQ